MMRRLGQAFIDLFYPPLCLHCRAPLDKKTKVFCTTCFQQMELIDPSDRCPYCFSQDYESDRRFCPECYRRPPILDKVAAAFDYDGPAASFIRHLKYADQSYLATGGGAYLAAQYLRLEWPLPDYIIPVPISFMHWIDRGYNQSFLLAESCGVILQRPVHDILHRLSGDYSQAGLSVRQRHQLDGGSIHLKSCNMDLRDTTLLL